MDLSALYDITRTHRDRARTAQTHIVPGHHDWQPADADNGPTSDPNRWWYLQGKAEAFAAIMSEIEHSR
jgi:hypothetical protein